MLCFAVLSGSSELVWQEIMLQRVMSQIAAVKKDMIILEKSEFSALLAESEVCVLPSRELVFWCCYADGFFGH